MVPALLEELNFEANINQLDDSVDVLWLRMTAEENPKGKGVELYSSKRGIRRGGGGGG